MNKRELIAAIASDAGITKKTSGEFIDALVATIEETLAKGEAVQITGFGTIDVTSRSARTGINPRTGKKMKIKAAKVPRFRAGETLRSEIKGRKK